MIPENGATDARPGAWVVRRFAGILRRWPLLTAAAVVLLLAGALAVAWGTVIGLTSFMDAAYPDSATLVTVGEFVRSGTIYPDLDRPPYLVSLYGPLTYVLLAIPYAVAQVVGIPPATAVRIVMLGALCVCLLLVSLLSRRLYGSRPVSWLCVLFALSASPLANAPIRGDLLAAAFSLLSVHLILRGNGRFQVTGTALCAATAVLVKQTFIAAPVAITCWLVYRRRYRDAAAMVAVCAMVVAGGYAFFLLRDPASLQHLAAIRHPIFDLPGALALIRRALWEPVVPFAALGGLLILWRRDATRLPLLIYCIVAWLAAFAAIPQIGGGMNYFYEPLLASAVLAGSGLHELQRQLKRAPWLLAVAMYGLLIKSFVPILREDISELRQYRRSAMTHETRKARWESFAAVVSGRRLLSTWPEVTVRSSVPEIPDPFLNSTLELSGTWDSGPVAAEIESGVFELVVISTGEAKGPRVGYRGIHGWSDAMWDALHRSYRPFCEYDGMEVWLPAGGSAEVGTKLLAIGCQPLAVEAS